MFNFDNTFNNGKDKFAFEKNRLGRTLGGSKWNLGRKKKTELSLFDHFRYLIEEKWTLTLRDNLKAQKCHLAI